jgi:hypothetical protein
MKRDDLLNELWRDAAPTKRLIGRRKFDAIFDAAIATAPLYQLWQRKVIEGDSDQGMAIKSFWSREIRRQREVQFGPLTWIIVGSIINFIINRLLEWATRSNSNAVLLAGWNSEHGRRR